VCLASAGERQSLTFAEVFQMNVGVPKMLLFLGDVDDPATKQSLDWAADLSKALLPRTMPLGIPNEESNAKIFETFGINKQLLAGAKLPMAMAIDGGELKSGVTIDMKMMKADWTYANLLEFGQLTGLPVLQGPPDSFDQAALRVTSRMDFYDKCVKPGGRCAMFALNSETELLALQKFREIVESFQSLAKRFRFMWCLGTDLKPMMNIPHFTKDFPMMVLLDPTDKLLVPFPFADRSSEDIADFLSGFDSNATLPEIKESIKSGNPSISKTSPKDTAGGTWGDDIEKEQLTLHEEL
jgi:hypothetical protein